MLQGIYATGNQQPMLQGRSCNNRASKTLHALLDYLPVLYKKFDFYFGTVYNRFCDKTVNFIAILFSVFVV